MKYCTDCLEEYRKALSRLHDKYPELRVNVFPPSDFVAPLCAKHQREQDELAEVYEDEHVKA